MQPQSIQFIIYLLSIIPTSVIFCEGKLSVQHARQNRLMQTHSAISGMSYRQKRQTHGAISGMSYKQKKTVSYSAISGMSCIQKRHCLTVPFMACHTDKKDIDSQCYFWHVIQTKLTLTHSAISGISYRQNRQTQTHSAISGLPYRQKRQ